MSGLLDEIAGHAPIQTSPTAPSVKADVVQHLQALCTTRRGTMLVAPSYGIDDVTMLFHEMPGGMEQIRVQLVEAIRLYEPRLANVRVTSLPSSPRDLVVRFEIGAAVVLEGRLLPIRFTAAMDGAKHVVFG